MVVARPAMGGSYYPAPDHFHHYVLEDGSSDYKQYFDHGIPSYTVHVMSQLSAY